MAQED